MPSKLTRTITRMSEHRVRDAGKMRRIVFSVTPDGMLALRLERCRRVETITLSAVYQYAVRSRVAFERAERLRTRKARAVK